jgi:hypothetical protein
MNETRTRRDIGLTLMLLLMVLTVCTMPPKTEAVTLQWTAVGDDGQIGAADHYVIAWSQDSVAIAAWACDPGWCDPGGTSPVNFIIGDSLPAGVTAGTPLMVTLPDGMFPSGAVVFFSAKAFDDAGNASSLGNICRKVIPDTIRPAAIMDLR